MPRLKILSLALLIMLAGRVGASDAWLGGFPWPRVESACRTPPLPWPGETRAVVLGKARYAFPTAELLYGGLDVDLSGPEGDERRREFEAVREIALDLWKMELTRQEMLAVRAARNERALRAALPVRLRDGGFVVVELEESYVGKPPQQMVVVDRPEWGEWGRALSVGEEYFLDAQRFGRGWTTNYHSSTRPREVAEADIAAYRNWTNGYAKPRQIRGQLAPRPLECWSCYERSLLSPVPTPIGAWSLGEMTVRLSGAGVELGTQSNPYGQFYFNLPEPGVYRLEIVGDWRTPEVAVYEIDARKQACTEILVGVDRTGNPPAVEHE